MMNPCQTTKDKSEGNAETTHRMTEVANQYRLGQIVDQ
jgi:hypothetical protein